MSKASISIFVNGFDKKSIFSFYADLNKMSQLISKQDVQLIEQKEQEGRKVYKSNPHYQMVANLMENPEFRKFYNEYLQDLTSIKTIMLFLKLYETVEQHAGIELSPYQKIAIIKDLIEDATMRRKACSELDNILGVKKEKLPVITDE